MDSELRKQFIEKYMEVAKGFYFEGSLEAKAAINAKITELLVGELESLPIFYEYVESGGDRVDSQATIYIRERIKHLQASQPINVEEKK